MQAQTLVNQLWKERTGYPTKAFDFMSATRGKSVGGSKGSADNVYVVGNTYHLGEEENAVVYKYTITGSLVWTYEYNSVSDYRDFGTDIYCKNGYVYVTGVSWDSASNYSEIIVLALDETDGTEVWSSIYTPGYGGMAVPAAMQVDGEQNVYVAGTEQTDSAEYGLVTFCMKDGGTLTWATVYDSLGKYDGGVALKIYEGIDTLVKVTGYSGAAFGNWDFLTLNIDNDGNVLTTARSSNGNGNFSYPVDLTTDYSGNLYVLGTIGLSATNRDWKLIKYDTLFNEVWVKTYGSADSLFDEPSGLVADYGGQLLLTGYTSTTNGSNLATTVRYNTNGTITWQKHIASPVAGENARARDIVLPLAPNTSFYICGSSYHQGDDDFFTAKYDIDGNLKWLKYFNDTTASQDEAQDIQVMEDGYILTSGISKQDSTTRYVSVAYKEADFYIPAEADSPSTAYTFYENRGQILINDTTAADSVFYYTNAGNPQLYVGQRKLSYVLASSDSAGLTDTVYRIDFTIGSAPINSRENIFEDKKSESFLNYFLGQLPGPVTKVQGYNRLVQKEVIRDIDWHLYATTAGIKNYLVVKPNTSTANLKIKYTGADSISIANKRLTLHTAIGNLTLDSLVAFTVNSSGVRTSVTVNYVYDSIALDKFKFSFGSYTASEHLVVSWKIGAAQGGSGIDNLEWSTYLGGYRDETVHDIKADNNNVVYTTGSTNGEKYPVLGASQVYNNNQMTFLTSFRPNNTMAWSVLFGGPLYSEGWAITIGEPNQLLLMGHTKDFNFPIYQPTNSTNYQATGIGNSGANLLSYISSFNTLTGIRTWASYFDGSQNSIAIGDDGSLYMVGEQPTSNFPTTTSATGNFNYTTGNATISRFNADLELTWATRFGSSYTTLKDLTPMDDGSMYMVGHTNNTTTNLPIVYTTPQYTQTFGGGDRDGLIMQFSATDNLVYSTFIGGSGDDNLSGASSYSFSDAANVVHFCGYTTSDDFPTIDHISSTNWQEEGYVINSSPPDLDGIYIDWSPNNTRRYITYYGGSESDKLNDVFTTTNGGYAYVIGTSTSSDVVLETPTGFYSSSNAGESDILFARFDIGNLDWSTYFGSSEVYNGLFYLGGEEDGEAICVTSSNYLYGLGSTNSMQPYAPNGVTVTTPLPLVSGGVNAYNQQQLNLFPSGSDIETDGVITKFNLSVASSIGGETNEFQSGLILLPNPCHNILWYKLQEGLQNSKASVFDVLGNKVAESEINKTAIDVTALASGVYVVIVSTDKETFNAKFIKQ